VTDAQHSLPHSVALHLVPGILTTAAYLFLGPFVMARGFPALSGLILAVLFVMIPLELGYLLYQAKKTSGTYSLRGIVLYREPIPRWQYVILTLALMVWGFLASALLHNVETDMSARFFTWLPKWFFVSSLEEFSVYSRSALLTTFLVGIVINAFAGPIVEELYFRGYLLPRISRFGRWSGPLNVVLFSLYHLWTPWQNLSRILFMLPVVDVVWRKRNIYVGLLAHGILNLIVWCLTFGSILAMGR